MATESTTSIEKIDKPQSHNGIARKATAVVATLGAAAVATTAVAAPADAAGRYGVWNRVASCESSNNWHINTGNGFYGGLQFTSSTWAAYGGHRYASEANYASRIEQIQVARRVLNSQGPGAWPVCGPRAGLNRWNGHATGAALPANPGGFSAHHRAKHRHHARAHHRRHHARHSAANHRHYRVRSGDTLSAIAQRHHMGWHRLYRLNRHRLASPNMIRVGQILLLP